MMRLAFNSMPLSFISARAVHISATGSKRFAATAVEDKTAFAASRAITDYANIFTQEGNKVFIHAAVRPGRLSEKRRDFVKLYMYANYLIGHKNIALSELTSICNREGYRSNPNKGKRGHRIRSDNFKTSLMSNANKNLFHLSLDERGKTQIALTDKGINQMHDLANTLNYVFTKEPTRRVKDVLTVFKKNKLLIESDLISRKRLRRLCENHGYFVRTDNLKTVVLQRTPNPSKQMLFTLLLSLSC
ncbi:MAG: hypothetical protein KDK56_10795 [Simkania sp.]|nr:hypothetical protein [Simkania sp.]MCB1075903.1 hypothetical protein [Simkania sp.]